MALLMPRPTRRPESTFHIFRARVPADVMEAARGRTLAFPFPAEAGEREHVVFTTAGDEVKFSLRTRDPSVAKSRHGIALAHLEKQWSAIRSGPKALSHRQIIRAFGRGVPSVRGSVRREPRHPRNVGIGEGVQPGDEGRPHCHGSAPVR